MTRLAYAARQLLKQVDGEPVGDPDGLGVIHNVMVSANAPVGEIAADPRVAEVVLVNTELGEVALVKIKRGRDGDVIGPFVLG